MRWFSICTLFFSILFLAAAVPVPVPRPNDPKPPGDPNAPPSRPHTPTPEDDHSVPLPGRTGTHTNTHAGVVTLHYGDDRLPEHMGHLQRNQAEFPHNRQPNRLAHPTEQNRAHALHNIPAAGTHPVTGLARVRDEKSLNMLHNPHHATSTTVEYLPDAESRKEGGHAAHFKAAIQKLGTNGQGQLRPNPGWLPLHPDQRRGHEAPARLNTQYRADGTHFKPPGPKPPPKPKPLPAPRVQRPPTGPSNLRPGNVSPPGHVWHPSTGGVHPSHSDAPGHLSEAAERHPPRPQNRKHYMQQLQAGRAVEANHRAAANHGAAASHGTAANDRAAANLRLFEQRFPARHGGAAGRAHEAPARMPDHSHSHSAAHTTPHSAQGHQSRPSSPHSQNPPHGSKPKGGPSGKK